VGLRFAWHAIDGALNDEGMLIPALGPKGIAKSLRALRFATTRSDDFLDRNRRSEQHILKHFGDLGKVNL